jgi:hypothetical protein
MMPLPYVTSGFPKGPVFLEFFASEIFSPYFSNGFKIDHGYLPFAVF